MLFEDRNRYIRSTLNQILLSVPDYVAPYGICLLQIDSSAILDDRYAHYQVFIVSLLANMTELRWVRSINMFPQA
jgi:hypothetical protein